MRPRRREDRQIEEIYLDAETDQPAWALVHTGLFGHKRTFVPLREADERRHAHRPVDKETVKDAPKIDPTAAVEARGGRAAPHYGVPGRA